MLKPNVAKCFNSSCDAKFKRMGDGKLFVEPHRSMEKGAGRQVVWLCSKCSRDHRLRFDDGQKKFVLHPHRPHEKRIA